MTTQADSPSGLRRSLDSKPTQGQGQAASSEIDVTTPLPKGWASFCSKPDPRPGGQQARWYATAPWNVPSLHRSLGKSASGLYCTVDASTWVELHQAVAEQVEIYERITA
jgi:hypothetical protein